MAQNWLVAVDDSVWASYAFNFASEFLNKKLDHLYLMHVSEEPTKVFVGYATSALLESLQKVEEEKARKILVHYGRKCKELGIQYTMMKGTDSNPGALLCKAVKNYSVHHLVLGRRSMGSVQRFFVGSTSKYCVENAECNVIVVKVPVGEEEEHDSRSKIIQEEEHERVRRIEEDLKLAGETDEQKLETLKAVKEAEEEERIRRIKEDGDFSKDKIKLYKFLDEIKTHT